MNTEDKQAWCTEFGEKTELGFCVDRMFRLGVATWPNPEKRTNIYAHDLMSAFPSDLKTVRTPLFKANDLYGIDPQFAVTFNEKDGRRYAELYPNIIVIFDVMWETTEMIIGGLQYNVKPMHRTYVGFLSSIRQAIKMDGSHKIEYARRKDDESGNAKTSFVFDVRRLQEIKVPA